MALNKYWFKQKKFGFGAYPNTWEGFLVVFIIGLFVIYRAYYITETNQLSTYLQIIIAVIILIIISYVKTKDGYKWHWGN